MTNNYYDYNDLREKAVKATATKEDRLALLNWLEQHGTQYWNGESYDIDNGLTLTPIFEEIEDDEFEIVDAEIK